MEEKDFIFKLTQLKKIKPKKEWVVLTKERILKEEKPSIFSLLFKPAYSILFLIFVFFGLFGLSQFSLPGDFLYPVKKITEGTQKIFLSEEEKPAYQLELAQKRLEELKILAEKNQTTKLPTAFEETKKATSEAAKNLAKTQEIDQKIVENVLKFEKTKEEVENKILATKIGIDEEENLTKIVIERLISDIEKKSLLENEKEILEVAKKYFEEGKFLEALIELQKLNENF